VQRAFGVLQAQFVIVRGPARMWDKATLRQIMTACVIMHNMIIEDERSEDEDEDVQYEGVGQLVRPTPPKVRNRTQEFYEFLQTHHNITNRQIHTQLQQDLIKHLWQHHPDMYQY
jgi:IMP dehydrogenase/GMP reductase